MTLHFRSLETVQKDKHAFHKVCLFHFLTVTLNFAHLPFHVFEYDSHNMIIVIQDGMIRLSSDDLSPHNCNIVTLNALLMNT